MEPLPQVRRDADAVELYFPPLRAPQVALTLAAFGAIASALAIVGGAMIVEGTLLGGTGFIAAMLMIVFIVPLGIFGVIFIALAAYMVCNGLLVRIDASGIETQRTLFGRIVARKRIERGALQSIEPEIVSRHQSIFATEAMYSLVARDAARSVRVTVAESLPGEARMNEVKALIEGAAAPRGVT